ncbi:MAG: branched-chain amino acid ABC transporter permease [Actinobacteria bacterium]|nr:branched-chain amino acid ABC transporter permease [Actinomycetota bacterium]
MRGWSRHRLTAALGSFLALALFMVAGAVGVDLWGDTSFIRVATNFFIIAGLVVALQVFVGNSGIVSFGHVAFFGTGAYVAALVSIPPAIKATALPELPARIQDLEGGVGLAVLLGAVAAAVFALVTGLALSRMEEAAMAMATLALLVMTHSVFANWEAVTRGTIGIFGVPRNVTLWIAMGAGIGAAGLALAFKASPIGLAVQATRDDPLAARSLGIDVARTRLAAWTMSALLMGGMGALWAENALAFGPNEFFFAETFTLLSMLVIGGMASVTGAVAGAAVVTLVSELLREVERGLTLGPLTLPELPGAVQLAVALLIMVVLIFRPAGLFGGRELSVPVALPWRGR